MNVFLWILQVLLALHTAMGAVWKLSNSEQVPGLTAIPHAVWLGLSGLEVLACVGLLLPAVARRLGRLVPLSAGFIVAEMLLFTGVHLASGAPLNGEVAYWLIVAALCGFLAWARFSLRPIAPTA